MTGSSAEAKAQHQQEQWIRKGLGSGGVPCPLAHFTLSQVIFIVFVGHLGSQMATSFLGLRSLLGCLYTRLFHTGGLNLHGSPAPRGGSTRLAELRNL